jgi:hypothetical protein
MKANLFLLPSEISTLQRFPTRSQTVVTLNDLSEMGREHRQWSRHSKPQTNLKTETIATTIIEEDGTNNREGNEQRDNSRNMQ